VGTSGSEVYHVPNFSKGKAADLPPVVRGHFDGELWGLAVHPKDANVFATCAEDNKILLYSLKDRKLIAENIIASKAGSKPEVRKASTTSTHPTNQCGRALGFSADGTMLAVGTNAGEVNIYHTDGLSLIASQDLNSLGKRHLQHQTQNWIETLAFSPDGGVLAVGTHGMVIALLDVKDGFKPKGTLTAHNAPVAHLDWSEDGAHIQSNCVAFELLFHDIDHKDLSKSKQNPNAHLLKDVKWHSQTCILGWPVQGIFDPAHDGNDVHSCDASPSRTLLVTGDDFGHVNLYRYPVEHTGNKFQCKSGHSSHVPRVRWTRDEKYVVSAGGADKAVIQWKLV